jgi:hypothetical protein
MAVLTRSASSASTASSVLVLVVILFFVLGMNVLISDYKAQLPCSGIRLAATTETRNRTDLPGE